MISRRGQSQPLHGRLTEQRGKPAADNTPVFTLEDESPTLLVVITSIVTGVSFAALIKKH